MRRMKKRRGVSLGTIVMLTLTVAVVGSLAAILPRLMGDVTIALDSDRAPEALHLSDALPALAVSDVSAANPESAQTGAPSTAQPAPQITSQALPTATPVAGGSFTLTIGGSVNMDTEVRQSGYYSDSKKYDFSETLSLLAGEMTGDLTLLTFENLVIPTAKVSSLITPPEMLDTLKTVGVDALALGFSQSYDQGGTGLDSTIQEAESRGLTVAGAFDGEAADAQPPIFTLQGVRVAVLHYADALSSKGKSAMRKDGRSHAVPLMDADTLAADIAGARAQGAQMVIVSLNWNSVKRSTPTKDQQTFAQQAADAGADLIVGVANAVQPVTWLTAADGRRVLCAYSLGKLLNAGRNDGEVAALLLQLTMTCGPDGQVTVNRAAYTPTYIWRYRLDGKYYYRVVASDRPSPMGMGDDQTKYKDKALANLQKILGEDTPLSLR